MTLDQPTKQFLAVLAESGSRPIHELTPDEARAIGPIVAAQIGEPKAVHRRESLSVPLEDGTKLEVRVHAPEDPRAVIVYMHGGGWVICDANEFDAMGAELALRTNSTVVMPNYRKAPEHRYPTAADDSWQALQWVSENLADLGGSGLPLVVMGESSGGNLAAVLARRARDAGGPALDLQVLIYPVTDCDVDAPSYLDPENQLMTSRDQVVWFWDQYLPDAERRTEPDASPMRAADLSNLAPAIVVTAQHDPLHGEGVAYAEALAAAGVSVQHRDFEGQMHGFFTMINILPGSEAGITWVTDQINAHLGSL